MGFQPLPTGYQDFRCIREDGCVYIDKTATLLSMIEKRRNHVFLSRPRRFGKSLTISTLAAMFEGRAELFRGLAAEEWVKDQSEHPAKVISLSMPVKQLTLEDVKSQIQEDLEKIAAKLSLQIKSQTLQGYFSQLIQEASDKYGRIVILIDEYDGPILDRIDDSGAAERARRLLQSVYSQLKKNDAYIQFLMVTGISKFSRLGLFSGMNNLLDISMNREYGALCGYTQEELESYFPDRLQALATERHCSYDALLQLFKEEYDGFCFDGVHKVYNPWAVLNSFDEMYIGESWCDSASSEFLVKYLKQHRISSPDAMKGRVVARNFMNAAEIENAEPESLLYQSGYLTISSMDGDRLTLDYPNAEVLKALSRMYMKSIYNVSSYVSRGETIKNALDSGDVDTAMREFSGILTVIPYTDLTNVTEGFYRSVFLVTLCAIGVACAAETQNSEGRSDIIAMFDSRICVFELKVRRSSEKTGDLLEKAKEQIRNRRYDIPFAKTGKIVMSIAVVIDDATHTVAAAEEVL